MKAIVLGVVALGLMSAPAVWAAQSGEQVYKAVCMVCHATGVAGAPKLGDKAAWKPRIKTGKAALYASALKGKNAMPAKGGRADLTDAEVKSATNYMLAKAK